MIIDAKERYKICQECEYFDNTTKICKECWCFMPAKTKLPMATCPKDKWEPVNIVRS